MRIEQIERLLREAGTDWDRRTHRLAVIAEAAAPWELARAWRMRSPRDADGLVLEAWVGLVRGRHAGRMDDARAAVEYCHRAAEAVPADPTAWVALLGILRLVRADSRELFAVWDEVVSRDPWNREAFLQMLRYLSPEECGSSRNQMDFVESLRASMPSNAPAAGVELTAVIDAYTRKTTRPGVEALLARHHWTTPWAVRAVNAALAEWLRPGHLRHAAALADLNLLAFALVRAGRVPESAGVFRLLGGTVTEWPWTLDGDPLERFGYWQAKAMATA
ncbi:hypothetical protein [Streptomyces sp. NRRL WC-3742]|uniref:hypothetical protein n=1 Tax=Streptomyces sp. NRRL WC-3742 TaxID=1463934 RepID=UPI00069234F8|nr:hypothetical protein [Streptomyces sp. NRRL WC-3742]